MLDRFVMGESDLSEEIETEQCKDNDPDCKVNLSVENAPVICLVSYAEELETECKLYETKHNLHRVEPSATALSELLEK